MGEHITAAIIEVVTSKTIEEDLHC